MAVAVATYVVANAATPTYRAEAQVQIIPRQQSSSVALGGDQLLQITNFYSEVAETRQVIDVARREGGFRESIVDAVDVETEPDLLLLSLTAESENPRRAADYANAYARALENEVAEVQASERERILRRPRARAADLQRRLQGLDPESGEALALTAELESLQDRLNEEELSPTDRVRIIQPALVPTEPAAPKPLRDSLLAFLLALVGGATFVALRNAFTDRFASVEEAAVDMRLPALAELPRARANSPVALEAFRKLRAQVEFSTADGRVGTAIEGSPRRDHRSVVLVTSPETGSGKSYVTSNLARAFAAHGRQVLAIDGDLRRPTLHQALEVPLANGLGDLLRRGNAENWSPQVKAAPVPRPTRERGGSLDVLTAGNPEGETAEALSSEAMGPLIDAAHARYELVLVDSPPVLAIVDAVVLSRYVDAVVLVVDAHRSRRRNVRRAVQTLRAVEAPLLGLIFNKAKVSGMEYAYYGYAAPPERIPERLEHPG